MRATTETIRARVNDIIRILLDGAQPWDCTSYVSEREATGDAPWAVPEGGKPLSSRQIRRYVEGAEREIGASCRTQTKKLLRRHLAQRRSLYARAVNKGDERTALAVLRDEAELLGLYESELTRQVNDLRQRMARLQQREEEKSNGHSPADPTRNGEGH
jgi:hypothetical protein